MRNTVFMVNQVGDGDSLDGDGDPVPNWCGDCLRDENPLEMSDKDWNSNLLMGLLTLNN